MSPKAYAALLIGDIYQGELPQLFAEMAQVFAYEPSADVDAKVMVGRIEVNIRAFSTTEIDQAAQKEMKRGIEYNEIIAGVSPRLCASVNEFCAQGPSIIIAGQTVLFEHVVSMARANQLLKSDPAQMLYPVIFRFSGYYGNPGGGYTGKSAAFSGYRFDMEKSLDLLARVLSDTEIITSLFHIATLQELEPFSNVVGDFNSSSGFKPILPIVSG